MPRCAVLARRRPAHAYGPPADGVARQAGDVADQGAGAGAGPMFRFAVRFALVVALSAACSEQPAAPAPPNVLIVVIDTLRADRCSFLGYERRTTPRLEEFAAESLVFTDAWASSPWTLPSHAGLFTGRGPAALGLADASRRELAADAPTLAEILGEAGWDTGSFSANPWIAPVSGVSRGFERIDPLWLISAQPKAADVLIPPAAWIAAREREGRQWFAFVNIVDAHAPYDPPEERAREFVRPGLPASAVAEARTLFAPKSCVLDARAIFGKDVIEAASDLYDADVADTDAALGAFLDKLRRDGVLDRTLVVICSDHGEGLGDHGWMEHSVFLHREVLRVPLLVRLPGGGTRRVIDDVVRLEDVFPTVLEVCGTPAPPRLEAKSLLGDTAGRTAVGVQRMRPEFLAEFERLPLGGPVEVLGRLRRSVRSGDLHLIVDAVGAELYDVKHDPGELTDLAAQRPADVARLRAILDFPPPGERAAARSLGGAVQYSGVRADRTAPR